MLYQINMGHVFGLRHSFTNSYLYSGALNPGSPRLRRNVAAGARPHDNVSHKIRAPGKEMT